MKYKIYKLDKNLGSYRWWRNYDTSHRNLPDVDIEKYLSYLKFNWVEFKNTKDEAIKYESVSKDSFDSIELYLPQLNEIPDYIKVEYELAEGKTESLYYFLEDTPSLFNAVKSLNSIVRYTLDKSVGFYKFHKYLIERNPQMFFVRKHYDRSDVYKIGEIERYGFDFITQPWLQEKTQNITGNLVVKETKTLKWSDMVDALAYTFTNMDFLYTTTGLRWKSKSSTTWNEKITCKCIANNNSGDTSSITRDFVLSDSLFQNGDNTPFFDYIVVKPNGYLHKDTQYLNLTGFFLFPIIQSGSSADWFGNTNYVDSLSLSLPELFKSENIIGRFTTMLSPSAIACLYADKTLSNGLHNLFVFDKEHNDKATYSFGAILTDGLPNRLDANYLNNVMFLSKLKTLLANNNGNSLLKTKENNPHLFAPQYWNLTYATTTNDKAVLTSNYLKLHPTETTLDPIPDKLPMEFFISSDWISRFNIPKESRNENMIWSYSGNEFLVSETKNAPIQCSAWANTYQQRQQLDMGRNVMYQNAIFGTGSTVFGSISKAFDMITSGKGGTSSLVGGITSIGKTFLDVYHGEAQYQLNRDFMMQQANSYNAPVSLSGLTSANWSSMGITLYTMGLTDQEQEIVNNDDNMYGYYVKKWLPYKAYDNCCDGNYMLCDMSKNYNNVFNILKDLDSIWTKGDNYINQFINALNNGITWFTNGAYVDLATDLLNVEKSRPFDAHVTKPASISRYLPFNEQVCSYDVTAVIDGTQRDLNLSHYELANIPDSCNATLELTENAVMVHINRIGTMRVQDISIQVKYKLISDRYWSFTSNDVIGWLFKDPKGTYDVHATTGTYNDIVSVGVVYNGEIDNHTDHYTIDPVPYKKEIGVKLIPTATDVRLYSGSQLIGRQYTTGVTYNYNGLTIKSGDIILRVLR